MIKELKDTVEPMTSSNYKSRFRAEYWQTKIRYEKLKDFCNKIEASQYAVVGVREPNHDCPLSMLREQQTVMGSYLHILELRAVIENIDLCQEIKSNDLQHNEETELFGGKVHVTGPFQSGCISSSGYPNTIDAVTTVTI